MKKVFIYSFILTTIIILCSPSCKKNVYAPSCSSSTPSYSNEVKALIQSYCSNCHSNYSSYAGANANRSSIRASIIDGTMPKNTTLTTDQKNSIICWIDGGAPNN